MVFNFSENKKQHLQIEPLDINFSCFFFLLLVFWECVCEREQKPTKKLKSERKRIVCQNTRFKKHPYFLFPLSKINLKNLCSLILFKHRHILKWGVQRKRRQKLWVNGKGQWNRALPHSNLPKSCYFILYFSSFFFCLLLSNENFKSKFHLLKHTYTHSYVYKFLHSLSTKFDIYSI